MVIFLRNGQCESYSSTVRGYLRFSSNQFSLERHESIALIYVIYKALCFDVAQGRMNGAPNETRTHSCRSASLAF